MKYIPTLTVVTLLTSASFLSAAATSKKWRILFNSDGGTPVLYHFEPPITPDQLCRVVTGLKGTQVDVFIQCVQFSDDQFLYNTKIGEIYDGRYIKDGKFEDPNFRKWALNVRSLLDKGLDPLAIWAQRTHELGMEFWPSMRMNDIHKDWVDRWPSSRSQWERKHKHLLIGKDYPDRYARKTKKTFTWAMNYAEPRVRNRKLALIDEICTNFDVDGFELDFQSHPYYFKKGQERSGMTVMNDFMRKVRARLNEIGKQKGKELTIQVRVPPNFKECDEVGLGVRTWIKEGLVDVVAVQTRGYLDMNADVASFVEAAKGTACKIAGGLEYYVRYYTGSKTGRATIEMMRAAASGYWHEGADCIYLFNYDAHGGFPFKGKTRQILEEIGSPKTLVHKNKHYYVTRDMEALTPEQGGDKQLPVDLTQAGAQRQFTFTVGDDLASAGRDGVLKAVRLKVTFNKYDASKQLIRFRLNGQALDNETIGGNVFTFDNPPAREGKNELGISLYGRNETTPGPIRIEGIELFIEYASP